MRSAMTKWLFGNSGAALAYALASSDAAKTSAVWLGLTISALTIIKLLLELSSRYLGWPKAKGERRSE
jgi:hypothetical protein